MDRIYRGSFRCPLAFQLGSALPTRCDWPPFFALCAAFDFRSRATPPTLCCAVHARCLLPANLLGADCCEVPVGAVACLNKLIPPRSALPAALDSTPSCPMNTRSSDVLVAGQGPENAILVPDDDAYIAVKPEARSRKRRPAFGDLSNRPTTRARVEAEVRRDCCAAVVLWLAVWRVSHGVLCLLRALSAAGCALSLPCPPSSALRRRST